MLTLTVLGSGSSGNAAVVSNGRTTVLVDAGLSAKQLSLRLSQVGYSLEQIDAVLLTHEHLDHCRGIAVLSRQRELQLYANALTREAMSRSLEGAKVRWNVMTNSVPFELGDLQVECFAVPHDAADPVGFVIGDGHSRLGLVSDLGHSNRLIETRLSQCHGLFVEANYDRALLEADEVRPWATKQRISSPHGHLSNEQAAGLIASLAHSHLRQVVLGHLSDDCNRPELAVDFVRRALADTVARHARVQCAARHEPTPSISLAPLQVSIGS